jgi:hypothetical protein
LLHSIADRLRDFRCDGVTHLFCNLEMRLVRAICAMITECIVKRATCTRNKNSSMQHRDGAASAQRGLCRLLSGLVDSYVEAFDEDPLPVEVADTTYQRLLTLVASLDLRGDAEREFAAPQAARL